MWILGLKGLRVAKCTNFPVHTLMSVGAGLSQSGSIPGT